MVGNGGFSFGPVRTGTVRKSYVPSRQDTVSFSISVCCLKQILTALTEQRSYFLYLSRNLGSANSK